MKSKTKILPSYAIESFRFQDFKGIKYLEIKNLPEKAKWIFLTGENGFGKTSILQALASCLTGHEPHLSQFLNDETDFELYCSIHKSSSHILIREFKGFENNHFNFNYKEKATKKNALDFFQFLACYGSSRLDTYDESSSRKEQKGVTQSLYDTEALLDNIEHQLTRWYHKQKDEEFAIKFKKTKALLIELLQIKDIKIDFRTDKVTYIEKDVEGNSYQALAFSQLASGYRSLVSMIGDMILRLFKSQPDVFDPKDLEGIVIIDELDLHFHPKWQKRLPNILSKCFPKIQFIASTHSPIPLLGAPKNSVFLTVNRTTKEGITLDRLIHLEKDIAKLTPNLLLNSPIFGYAELFSSQFRSNQTIHTESSSEEVRFREQLKENLKKDMSKEHEEALKQFLKGN